MHRDWLVRSAYFPLPLHGSYHLVHPKRQMQEANSMYNSSKLRIYNELLLDKPGQRYTLQALVRSWWTQEINTPSSTIIINCQTRGGRRGLSPYLDILDSDPRRQRPKVSFPVKISSGCSQSVLTVLAGWLAKLAPIHFARLGIVHQNLGTGPSIHDSKKCTVRTLFSRSSQVPLRWCQWS